MPREQLTAHGVLRRNICRVFYRKTWMVQKEAAMRGVGGWRGAGSAGELTRSAFRFYMYIRGLRKSSAIV